MTRQMKQDNYVTLLQERKQQLYWAVRDICRFLFGDLSKYWDILLHTLNDYKVNVYYNTVHFQNLKNLQKGLLLFCQCLFLNWWRFWSRHCWWHEAVESQVSRIILFSVCVPSVCQLVPVLCHKFYLLCIPIKGLVNKFSLFKA